MPTQLKEQFEIVSLKDCVIKRINALSKNLAGHAKADFASVSPSGGDMGLDMFGSLMFDMCVFDALAGAIDIGLADTGMAEVNTPFNAVAAAAIDAYSMTNSADNSVYAVRANAVRAYYPKGRNKKPAIDPVLWRKFNKTANQNNGDVEHAQRELCDLLAVLKKLEALSDANVRKIQQDEGQDIKQTVHSIYDRGLKSGAMDMMYSGYRTAI